MIFSLPVE